jgi:hypothetical protein
VFEQVVDLAARYSAVILREEGGEVRAQYDSRDKSPFQFAAEIARNALDPECSRTICEDIPHGIKSLFMAKPVLRLQGAIMMASWKTIDRLYFMQPTTWMPTFPGVQSVPAAIGKGMTKSQKDKWRIACAEDHARRLGYEAPDLLAQWIEEHPDVKPLKKNTGDLDKSRSDYVSAWLMSEFLRAYNDQDLLQLTGVQIANI